MKKILSFVLALCMICTLLPATVLTANAADKTVTIEFSSKAQRDSLTTAQQVWSNDGVTFTNDKASSTNNVADYVKPVRLYKNSTITIEADGNMISKIVFDCNSNSYASTMKSSQITVGSGTLTASSDKVTFTASTPAEKFTFKLSGGQIRFDSMTVTYTEAEGACQHENIEPVGEAYDPSCTETGMTAGEMCADCGDILEPQEEIPMLSHSYENGVCTGCGKEQPKAYTLVKDINDLKVGDQIVIVADGYDFALSTTQNGNNRGQIAVEKNDDGTLGEFGDSVQVLTLEAGTSSGTFAFNTGNGYLYAASSSSNYLRTETKLSANSSWKITITSAGVATVIAQGNYTKNNLQYNASSKIFSCYSTSQKPVSIYKLPASTPAAEPVVEYTYMETKTEFSSWEEALEAAENNDNIGVLKLMNSLEIEQINLGKNLVLDLNGNTLTVTSIVATVKDSADGKGLVKTNKDSAVLTAALGNQMILWDNITNNSGYRVFNYTFTNMGMDANANESDEVRSQIAGTTVISFWSDLVFTNEYAYKLVASKEVILDIAFVLDWNGNAKTFYINSDDVFDWGASEESNAGEKNYCFYITVVGFDNLEEDGTLTVKSLVGDAFGNGAETEVTEFEYTKA